MADLPLAAVVGLFLAAAFVIAVTGPPLARLADQLADRTGLGEAMAGAILLGATTSTPGTVTSVVAGWNGNVDLAASNALGGIAAQTLFLAVADIFHRRANLEHAAASAGNLTQSTLLILLLAVPLAAPHTPDVTLLGVSPATLVLIAIYVFGVRLAKRDRDAPMWHPEETDATRHDRPDPGSAAPPLARQVALFVGCVAAIGVAGYGVAWTGIAVAERTGIGETVVGTLMTAVATSLPELITTVAAVRQGALQLAVGGIIGGNTFDVLFLAGADVAYGDGSIYHAVSGATLFWALVGLAMTAVLLLGLIRRERHGLGNIGFESALLIVLYAGAVALTV
jgi:cation:H+ antiporter